MFKWMRNRQDPIGAPGLTFCLQTRSDFDAADGLHPAGLQIVITAVQHFTRRRQFIEISGQSVLKQLICRAPGLACPAFLLSLYFRSEIDFHVPANGSTPGHWSSPSRRHPRCDKTMARAIDIGSDDSVRILDDEDDETLAAIDEGIRDAQAGRVSPIEEVRKLLPAWITASSSRREPSGRSASPEARFPQTAETLKRLPTPRPQLRVSRNPV